MRRIHTSRYVDCPFSATLDFAEKVVSRRCGLYLTPAPPLGERVRFAAVSIEDASDEARKHTALLLAWRPQNEGLFPNFTGVLTFRPSNGGARMLLSGRYEPPFGIFGRIFDTFFGRAIAQRTMSGLLDEIGTEIEAEYDAERRAHRSVS